MGHRKSLKRNLLIALLAGSAALYTMPIYAATSVIANNALPSGGEVIAGDFNGNPNSWASGLEMNIHQNSVNGVIKWDSFNVGGSATVNFNGPKVDGGYHTLNYVNGGNVSQIYGTINAYNNGNIYIVNPAGVQIGNSAQINVGSLYVSNAKIDNIDDYKGQQEPDIISIMKKSQRTNAELMSLGNINATKVTFEGNGRIVIDSERIKNEDVKLGADNIIVKTNSKDNVVIGYEAYDEDKKSYADVENGNLVTLNENGDYITKADGYMWVEDVEQLQAINTYLKGNYALRNSIDATSTEQNGFISIGLNGNNEIQNEGKGFTGNFDGIEYNIFGLNITGNNNAGLFGYTDGANINNVTLVGGSISGGTNVGAVVGNATDTTISNVVNSAAVTGGTNVGGIVGSATGTTVENAINTGAVSGSDNNVGGLIGEMTDGSKLIGNSYNLGNVGGVDEGANNTNYAYNVGGLVGYAVKSTIGNENEEGKEAQLVYNRLDVTGEYNVGGIVGNMEGSTVQNAENSATVTATGYYTDKYTYHTADDTADATDGENENNIAKVDVNVANVGGIAGTSSGTSTIKDVTNSGDVSSAESTYTQYDSDHTYYTAGNVGGIVGSAVDTNITNATNQENDIRGAHNVGGVAGYFGNSDGNNDVKYTITNGINNGGDIMATGARNDNGFVTETVRPDSGNEHFIIGNIGGIVGYLDGDNVKVTGSANRGTVHSQDIDDPEHVLYTSQAANVGGVVGKIDTSGNNSDTLLEEFRNGTYTNASVSNSYNTGDVRGYTGVGGVIGMMYNGSIAGSYNTGTVNTTRQVRTGGSNIDPLNMGGVVGDTTEQTDANAIIYDVYNKGQIGDETYNFYARHVGGVVGRLSGTLEKAYNNGDIYNNDTTVGGVVGWWYSGEIKNVFNTGNITVRAATELQVGGIVGASSDATDRLSLTNAYNLGTIRGYQESTSSQAKDRAIYVGGIIGRVRGGNTNITNVYTMGNLYAATGTYNDNGGSYTSTDSGLGAIYGYNGGIDATRPTLQGANYITPASNDFANLETLAERQGINVIDYGDRYKSSSYSFVDVDEDPDANDIFSTQNNGNVENATDDNWRIYEGETTPILNAFLPNVEEYFGDTTKNNMDGIDSIQYGTAYDPLLTIINANVDNLTYYWGDLGISGAASLVVNNAGLTLKNVDTSAGTGYYAGLLYSQGDLTLNAQQGENVSGDIGFGSEAKLYGSSVNINADGTVTIYGSVTATGEQDGSTGNITINAGDVDVYGTLTTGQDTSIAGIANSGSGFDEKETNFDKLSNPNEAMVHISDRFAHETAVNEQATADIVITAGTKVDEKGEVVNDENGNPVTIGAGNVNLYFGNKENGITTTGGNLTVEATGDVYVDSDLDIGGGLSLTAGADKEIVLDITNIGQVQTNHNQTESVNKLHDFLGKFNSNDNAIKFAGTDDAKITVDMWTNNNFDLDKFDKDTNNTLAGTLQKVHVNVNGNTQSSARDVTYIWVSKADQLNNIQAYKDDNADSNILNYNFALKNDINASDITDYKAIGGTAGFTGTFDGRGNRIIGLNVTADNAGIFSTIGDSGVVKNLNIYSGNFTGTDNAGAVAGVNNGRIENITAFGNTVTASGNAGGIVGENSDLASSEFDESENGGASILTGNGIYDVESTGSVIAGRDTAIAGGLVGTNEGALGNSFSNSAVTSNTGTNAGLGGVVGVNTGEVQYVDSLGVTNGGDSGSSNIGGVIGINKGNLYSSYNESIVSGSDNVGGIIGENEGKYVGEEWETGIVSNIVNATSVSGVDKSDSSDDASKNVGGLVGSNSGCVTNGRNNGTITGTNYVGGMVGDNAENSQLTDLVNDSSASITGEQYVGGIAGSNAGTISATDTNLINRGSITGQQYVGGVAGENWGTIENTNNNVSLNVKDSNATDDDAAIYFGGVTGWNHEDAIIGNATNRADVTAEGASYVGGVAGKNDGTLTGFNGNYGNVIGATNVGGVIGENTTDIEGVEAVNNGTVTATAGGAGGIFGVHTGNIIDSTLENTNEVVGNGDGGTGGIATTNSGKITNSTLINEGKVSNSTGNNVGGIFGIKDDNDTTDATITGSTLKNNGEVTGNKNVGGIFGSATSNVIIEKTSVINSVNGSVTGNVNVGGLIGSNAATITGGRNEDVEMDTEDNVTAEADSYYKYQIYNNGTITVTGSGTNIGGLIGNNYADGTLTAGYNTGAINAEGSTNVGGIAGSNSGIIDQVFNTVMTADGTNETITGGTNVGGLVGNNATDGELSNAYNTTDVIGTTNVGNAVGTNGGTISNIYATNTTGNLIGENTNVDPDAIQNAYSFSNADTENEIGVKVIDDNNQKNSGSYGDFDFEGKEDGKADWKIYEGYGNPLLKVFLTNLTVKDENEQGEKLDDHLNLVYNAGEQDLNIADLIDKGFITAPIEKDNEGNVIFDGLAAYKNTKEENSQFGNSDLLANTKGQENAGTHDNWLYSGQIADGSKDGSFNPNNLGYDIEYSNTTGTDTGITIDKAQITISLDEINRVYGNATINNVVTGGHDYGYNFDTSNVGMNNDLKAEIEDALSFTQKSDGAVDGVTGNKVTNDVKEGGYTWSAEFTLKSNNFEFSTNNADKSKLTIDNGISKVIKADLTITADDKVTMPGVMPEFTGTVDGLTNGDTLDYVFGLSSNNNGIINVDGNYSDVIGIVIDGNFYELGANWATGLFANYDVKYEMGNLTVSSKLLPDLPDNWPSNRWDYLFSDNPFDRNKNFRERKAEVNFVDGGMEI